MQNEKKAGVLLSYITLIANMIIQFAYTPIMLRLLGQSEYGLYTLSNSIISYLTLFDMGFAGSYLRFYSSCKVNNDGEGINRLNSTYLTLFIFLGLLAFLCGLSLTSQIEYIFIRTLTPGELVRAKTIMIILSFSLAINLLSSVFSSIITAHERFYELRIVKLMQTVCNPLIAIPMMLMGFQSVSIALASLLTSIWCFYKYVNYCFRKLNITFDFRQYSGKLIREVGKFSFFIFLNEIISQVNWSVDKVLLGLFYGTEMTAIYGVGSQIDIVYRNLSSSISSVFAPQVNRIVASNADDKDLTDIFCRVGRLQFIVIIPVLLGFIGFGQYFVQFWAGSEYSESYYVALLLIVPVSIPLIQNIGIEIQRAKNRHQFRSIVYGIMAVVNILISIPLCLRFGSIGSAAGTSISLFICNGLIINWYYQTRIGIDIIRFWKEICSFVKALIIPVIYIVMILILPLQWTWVIFLTLGTLFVLIYCFFMWKIGVNKFERDLIVSLLQKLRDKVGSHD